LVSTQNSELLLLNVKERLTIYGTACTQAYQIWLYTGTTNKHLHSKQIALFPILKWWQEMN